MGGRYGVERLMGGKGGTFVVLATIKINLKILVGVIHTIYIL